MRPADELAERDFAHTGPDTLAGRFMRSFWQPVGISEDLEPGCALPIRVMGEDFTLYRGETGAPHVVAGHCAHRGTQLSIGWVEGDCLRCFYHGWKYDQTGQCIEQAVEAPAFAAKVRIASYAVHEYLGLIFAYFGTGEPPPPPRYPEFEQGCVVDAVTTRVPYNFFQNLENSVDTLHVSWVHRKSHFFADARGSDFGNGTGRGASAMEGMVRECSGEETEYGFTFRDVFDDDAVRISHFELPTVLHIKVFPIDPESGWRDFVAWKVPIDDTCYRNFSLWIAHVQGAAAERYREHPRNPRNMRKSGAYDKVVALGEEILAGRLRLNSPEVVVEPALTVNLQDYIAQRGQGVIADRRHEQLGQSDRVVILLRKLWSREMGKLANGGPLKRWSWPGYLETTSGGKSV